MRSERARRRRRKKANTKERKALEGEKLMYRKKQGKGESRVKKTKEGLERGVSKEKNREGGKVKGKVTEINERTGEK